MPQLVKGGKYVFGWSLVGENGQVPIPSEAWLEYEYHLHDDVVLISGSKTSGGFGLIRLEILKESSLFGIIDDYSDISKGNLLRNEILHRGNRKLFVTVIEEEYKINVETTTLNEYGISINSKLLTVRGSGLGLGFIVKGPIYEEVTKHPELQSFS